MTDLLLARAVLEVYGVMTAYLVIAFVFTASGLYELPADWGRFLLGWLYFVLLTTGWGLVVGSLTEMYEWAEKLVGPLMYFLLPVCGFFYMADWLPEGLREAALYMPTLDAFELIRGGQFGDGVHFYYNLPYLTFACAVLIALGLALTRRVHHYLVIE
jgi:ABC-type polysaccharide/polyol phosphate export permease